MGLTDQVRFIRPLRTVGPVRFQYFISESPWLWNIKGLPSYVLNIHAWPPWVVLFGIWGWHRQMIRVGCDKLYSSSTLPSAIGEFFRSRCSWTVDALLAPPTICRTTIPWDCFWLLIQSLLLLILLSHQQTFPSLNLSFIFNWGVIWFTLIFKSRLLFLIELPYKFFFGLFLLGGKYVNTLHDRLPFDRLWISSLSLRNHCHALLLLPDLFLLRNGREGHLLLNTS